MVLIKVLTTVGIVLALSLVAERAGPRMAGILSGYPLGVALTLFFIGIEISPDYAAQSAVFAIAGLCATQAFVFVYYLVSRRLEKGGIAVSTLAATAGYLCAAAALRPIPFTRAGTCSPPSPRWGSSPCSSGASPMPASRAACASPRPSSPCAP